MKMANIIIFAVFAIVTLPAVVTPTSSSRTGNKPPIVDPPAIEKMQQDNYHALHMIWDRMRKINRIITAENTEKDQSDQVNEKWSKEVLHLAEKFLEEMEFFQEIQYYSLTQARNLLEELQLKQENKTHFEL